MIHGWRPASAVIQPTVFAMNELVIVTKPGNPLKISQLGLLIFYPDKVKFEKGDVSLSFPPKWLEVPIDDKGFIEFGRKVDKLLSGKMPSESLKCRWCKYRHLGDELAHLPSGPFEEDLPF